MVLGEIIKAEILNIEASINLRTWEKYILLGKTKIEYYYRLIVDLRFSTESAMKCNAKKSSTLGMEPFSIAHWILDHVRTLEIFVRRNQISFSFNSCIFNRQRETYER